MIPIRAHKDDPITTYGVRPPMQPGHPLAQTPCPVCDGPLTGAPITLVLVGFDPEVRAEGKAWRAGAAVVVHAACAGAESGPDATDG
jgi:hypothetical protein